MQDKLHSDVDQIRTKIDARQYQHDKKKALKAADDAEESATYAINYALDSIDYAEMAVLDAISARQSSEAM